MMKKLILTTAILGGSVAYAETINQPSLAPLNPQIITIDAETLKRLEESRLLVQQNLIALEEKVAVIEKNMTEMDLFHRLNSTTVHFETGSSELSEDQYQKVTDIANFLKEYPSYTVTLEGHADARGYQGYNYRLGEDRADTVKNILMNSGVSEDRVNIVSLGQHRPASAGVNEESWKQNRRVVFVLNR